MTVSYNQVAGRSLHRIEGLSDGLFAIALTLIVLEIRLPDPGPIHSEGDLWAALVALAPRFVTYLLSFMTLGIFWNGQQTQLHYYERSDRHLAWLNLVFLAFVALMPFSTGLLAEFITYRLALVLYWLNIVVLGLVLLGMWAYASRAGLVRAGTDPGVGGAIRRRIVVAQALYALGAALCLVSVALSILFIVLVQLNFALGARLPLLGRV